MTPEQHREIIEQLRSLQETAEHQYSTRRIFLTGIIYGVGFVIGSVVIATIMIGLLMPYIKDVPWVQVGFERGAGLIRAVK